MFYNPQLTVDRIDAQIAELNKLKTQVPSVQPITQNFQLAPQNAMRYANNIEEVNKEYVTGDTPFFTKDLSVLWIKSQNGSATFNILGGGIYKITFNSNVTSATAGNIGLAIFADGTQVNGTEVDTPVEVGVYTNVSTTKYLRVCGRGNVTITVRSVPTIIYDGTSTATQIPIIKNANITIKRYA